MRKSSGGLTALGPALNKSAKDERQENYKKGRRVCHQNHIGPVCITSEHETLIKERMKAIGLSEGPAELILHSIEQQISAYQRLAVDPFERRDTDGREKLGNGVEALDGMIIDQ
jgi:hypothetical protein